jgi:hypothetical protein
LFSAGKTGFPRPYPDKPPRDTLRIDGFQRVSYFAHRRVFRLNRRKTGTPYVIHPKNLKAENGVIFLPVYMTFLL